MKSAVVTSKAPAAIGPYSQGMRFGDMVFTSGQIPVDPDSGAIAQDIASQARVSLQNVMAVLGAAGAGAADVVKTTVFIRDMSRFPEVNAVYEEFFSGGNLPARSCVEVSALPKGVLVEIEAIAICSK